MNICVGSKNSIKVEAVSEIVQEYSHLKDAVIIACDVDSGVPDQPKSLEQTVNGAIHRAKASFADCTYSVGIESGLMSVPKSKTGFMDVCVCAIFDGNEYHLGLSSAWEVPKDVMAYILEEGMNMTDASVKAGLTDNPTIGAAEGLIGILSKGRLVRKTYTKEAIRTALIHLE